MPTLARDMGEWGLECGDSRRVCRLSGRRPCDRRPIGWRPVGLYDNWRGVRQTEWWADVPTGRVRFARRVRVGPICDSKKQAVAYLRTCDPSVRLVARIAYQTEGGVMRHVRTKYSFVRVHRVRSVDTSRVLMGEPTEQLIEYARVHGTAYAWFDVASCSWALAFGPPGKCVWVEER